MLRPGEAGESPPPVCRPRDGIDAHLCVRAEEARLPVDDACHPQALPVLKTRAAPFGVTVVQGNPETFDTFGDDVCGVLLQYPNTEGTVRDYADVIERVHKVLSWESGGGERGASPCARQRRLERSPPCRARRWARPSSSRATCWP